MDMFDAKRRDFHSMDDYMKQDTKKHGFGGPNTAIPFDQKDKSKLAGYQRVVERDPKFEGGKFNTNYDPTWKAVTRDIISRQANKKEFNPMYAKPTMATTSAVPRVWLQAPTPVTRCVVHGATNRVPSLV